MMNINGAKAWLGVAALGLVVSGCTCGGPSPSPCDSNKVTITAPTNNSTVNGPITVTFTVTDKDGKAITGLKNAAVCGTTSSGACDGTATTAGATINSNSVTFNGVVLQPGDTQVKATVDSASCTTMTGTTAVTVVTPDGGTPTVSCAAFPQDVNHDGTLNSTELPADAGSQLEISVNSTGLVPGGSLSVAEGSMVEVTNQTVTGGSTSVLIPAADSTDGVHTFTITGKSASGATATATCPAITIDRSAPPAAITAPTKLVLGPCDDADATPDGGFQISLTGTTNNTATGVQFDVLDSSGTGIQTFSQATMPNQTSYSHQFTLPAGGTTSYTLVFTAKGAQNNGSAKITISVDYDPPTVAITNPVASGSPYSLFTIDTKAVVSDTNAAGSTVSLQVSQGALKRTFVPLTADDGGVADSKENYFQGSQTLTVNAIDGTGCSENRSADVTSTFTVNASTGCSIGFISAPLDSSDPAFITSSFLDSSNNYSAKVNTTCTGQMMTLSSTPCAGGTPVAQTAPVDGSGNALFTVPVADGCFVWTASIGADQAVEQVTVSTTAPTIIFPQPLNGVAVLNILGDLDKNTPGSQSSLQYTATVPGNGMVDVCISVPLTQSGGVNTTPCPDGSSWYLLASGVQPSTPTFQFPDGQPPDTTYQIKLVVVAGTGSYPTSAAITLLVDTVAPVFGTPAPFFVNDTAPLLKLNAMELGGQHPQLQLSIPPDVAATTQSIFVNDGTIALNTPGNYTWGTGANVSTATVTLDLVPVTSVEQTYSNVSVTVTDVAGNPTTHPIGSVLVDTIAPNCVVDTSKPLLGIADTAVDGGFDLPATVTTSSDAASVQLNVTGGQTGMVGTTIVGTTATGDFPLNQTNGTQTYTITATCTDAAGNSITSATGVTVTVDLDRPICAITVPANGATLNSFNNATTVTVTGAEGQSVTINSSAQVAALGTLPAVSGGTTSGTITYPGGPQTITATVSDPAGNVCTSAANSITVNGTGCPISWSSPTLNPTTGRAYLTTNNFSITGTTSGAGCLTGQSVTLVDITGGLPGTVLGTGTTNGGSVTITGTKADGNYLWELQLGSNNSDLNITVDTVPPVVGSASPIGSSLFFVASDNIHIVTTPPDPAYIADLTPGAPADLTVTLTNVTGAANGHVDVVLNNGTPLQTRNITTDPVSLTIPVQLQQNDTGTFEIRVYDVAGNKKVFSSAVSVDVIAPGAPVFSQTLTNNRTAKVHLAWATTYDDGNASSSGPNAGYDIRWSTSTVANNNGLATEADYFNSSRANPDQKPNSSATSADVTVPPMNTYYIAVRAYDEVGNYSTYAAPAPLANTGTIDTFLNPSNDPSDFFGAAMASGNINNDTIADLVVGSPGDVSGVGRAFIYYGGASFAGSTSCGTGCQQLDVPSASPGDDAFGLSIAIGTLTDVATTPNLVVASPYFNQTQGRVFIFFGGTATLSTSTFIELRGPVSAGAGFGSQVKIIPSIDGDGIPELMVSAPYDNGNRGSVYIFKGRTKAQWQAAETATDNGVVYIPIASADWTIQGPNPVDSVGASGNFFGTGFSFTSVGDINADGKPDFTIGDPKNNINNVYVWSGATVAAATAPLTSGTGTTADQELQKLNIGTAGNGKDNSGFGSAVLGGTNFVNAATADLVVANADNETVQFFADGSGGAFPTTATVTIAGNTLNFGYLMLTGDFDGDGTNDVAVLDQATVTSALWVFYNQAGSFDPTESIRGFHQSTLSGSPLFGFGAAVGDFDNNTKPDIAVGDPTDGVGKVTVWHP